MTTDLTEAFTRTLGTGWGSGVLGIWDIGPGADGMLSQLSVDGSRGVVEQNNTDDNPDSGAMVVRCRHTPLPDVATATIDVYLTIEQPNVVTDTPSWQFSIGETGTTLNASDSYAGFGMSGSATDFFVYCWNEAGLLTAYGHDTYIEVSSWTPPGGMTTPVRIHFQVDKYGCRGNVWPAAAGVEPAGWMVRDESAAPIGAGIFVPLYVTLNPQMGYHPGNFAYFDDVRVVVTPDPEPVTTTNPDGYGVVGTAWSS